MCLRPGSWEVDLETDCYEGNLLKKCSRERKRKGCGTEQGKQAKIWSQRGLASACVLQGVLGRGDLNEPHFEAKGASAVYSQPVRHWWLTAWGRWLSQRTVPRRRGSWVPSAVRLKAVGGRVRPLNEGDLDRVAIAFSTVSNAFPFSPHPEN